MKSTVFECQQNQLSTALSTLSTTISKFPKFAKLYMVQGQIHQQQSNNTTTQASYAAGFIASPKEPTFWILTSQMTSELLG